MSPLPTEQDFALQYAYEPLKSLDARHQGSVYAGTDRETGEAVAIKCMDYHPNFGDEALLQAYAQRAGFVHPGLLPYKAWFRFSNADILAHRLVMPLVEGKSLAELSPERLTWAEKHALLSRLAETLAWLHERQAPCLNLEAGHLLLQGGQWKLINYGLGRAWRLELMARYTCIAPEQFSEAYQPDNRSDIWAWGCLAYWLYTGQWPFGQPSAQLTNRQLRERILYAPLPERLAELPEVLQLPIRRSLEKDPDLRPQSALALLALWPEQLPQALLEEDEAAALEAEADEEPQPFKPSPIGWHWWLLFPLAVLAAYALRWLSA